MKLSLSHKTKGSKDSFHLKEPIKIQHIHSSTEALRNAFHMLGLDRWGWSKGVAEETTS